MPVPSYSLRVCSRWKTLKIRSRYFSSKPMPLSLTVNSHKSRAVSGTASGKFPALATFTTGGHFRPAELERVADQILQQLAHLQSLRVNHRQLRRFRRGPWTCSIRLSRSSTTSRATWARSTGANGLRLGGHARKRQQVVDQRLHPRGRLLHALEIIPRLAAKRRGRIFPSAARRRRRFCATAPANRARRRRRNPAVRGCCAPVAR